MGRVLLRSKIHRAVVTQANRDYEGSITIDEDLMDAADICRFEQVHVFSITSGERLITYTIPGKRGSGIICMNGAAANRIKEGELLIIVAYCDVPEDEVCNVNPRIVLLGDDNQIKKVIDGHEHALNFHN